MVLLNILLVGFVNSQDENHPTSIFTKRHLTLFTLDTNQLNNLVVKVDFIHHILIGF